MKIEYGESDKTMDNKVIRYSIELAMLKNLFEKKLITQTEYNAIETKIKKDYGIVSNITT